MTFRKVSLVVFAFLVAHPLAYAGPSSYEKLLPKATAEDIDCALHSSVLALKFLDAGASVATARGYLYENGSSGDSAADIIRTLTKGGVYAVPLKGATTRQLYNAVSNSGVAAVVRVARAKLQHFCCVLGALDDQFLIGSLPDPLKRVGFDKFDEVYKAGGNVCILASSDYSALEGVLKKTGVSAALLPPKPKAVFPALKLNLAEAERKDKIVLRLPYRNDGSGLLVIKGFRVPCNCMKVMPGERVLEAGKFSEFSIEVDRVRWGEGNRTLQIIVMTNDPTTANVPITVEGELRKAQPRSDSLSVFPKQLELGATTLTSRYRDRQPRIHVSTKSQKGLGPVLAKSNVAGLKLALKEEKSGEIITSAEVQLNFDAVPEGRFDGLISLNVKEIDGAASDINVTVTGIVLPGVKISPEELTLVQADTDAPFRCRLSVEYPGDDEIVVERVELQSDNSTLASHVVRTSRSYSSVFLELFPKSRSPRITGQVVLQIAGAVNETRKVPFTGITFTERALVSGN